ncbi:MAG TPA: DUF2726 domain-containing protein [Arcobacter sp.]|nr:DUF2726 domain-containing protein [Arcobacter sp.]
MNPERMFQLLQKCEWEKLLEYEYMYQKEIINNPSLKSTFDKYFISSLLDDLKNKNDKTYSYVILKRVYQRFLQHRNKTYNIPEEIFEKLIIYYLEILQFQKEIKTAQHIANTWNHLDVCKTYLLTQPKEIKHSKNDSIKISENSNIKKENHTIPLFKSKQEFEFFYAIREYYPNYLTYPNVAISCVINYQKIQHHLNNNEKNYFFKSIIDSVVFIQTENNFEPKFYFELDSIYHDKEEQQLKDIMKDKFFSLAGQRLIRIRAKDNKNLIRNDFKKMIQEILSS